MSTEGAAKGAPGTRQRAALGGCWTPAQSQDLRSTGRTFLHSLRVALEARRAEADASVTQGPRHGEGKSLTCCRSWPCTCCPCGLSWAGTGPGAAGRAAGRFAVSRKSLVEPLQWPLKLLPARMSPVDFPSPASLQSFLPLQMVQHPHEEGQTSAWAAHLAPLLPLPTLSPGVVPFSPWQPFPRPAPRVVWWVRGAPVCSGVHPTQPLLPGHLCPRPGEPAKDQGCTFIES